MGIGHRRPDRGRAPEKLIGTGGVGQAEIDDLTCVAQALDGPHGGVGLELGAVVMGEMEGDKTGFHKKGHSCIVLCDRCSIC